MFFNLTLIPKIAPKSQKIDPKDQKKSAKEALNMARDGSRGGEWGDAPLPHRTQVYKGKSPHITYKLSKFGPKCRKLRVIPSH